MTDHHQDQSHPEPTVGGRHRAEPLASVAGGGQFDLGERTAANLVRALTTSGQAVIDLDDDCTLQAAALAYRLNYRAVDLTMVVEKPAQLADLVVLRWPRLDANCSALMEHDVFTRVRALCASAGSVAVILEPTPAHAFSITWAGSLLHAAANSWLPTLRDVIIVHDLRQSEADHRGAPAVVTIRQRVILVLGCLGGRHGR